MDIPSEPSKPSSGTATPDLCAKCRPTDCFSSHTYSASSCPYKLCPECRELEALDAQIMDARTILINLSKKRHELKVRINRRHDRLTSNLPIELISDIFALIPDGSRDRGQPTKKEELVWYPVLGLGAVCRRWRDITLSIPQLWTKLDIVPRKHGTDPDILEKWLSRSCSLPLTLEVRASQNDYYGFPEQLPSTLPDSIVLRLLRSHAHRWKDLTLRGPRAIFRVLLTGLQDKLSVDSLQIFLYDSASHGRDKIIMDYPFAPQRLLIDGSPLRQIPIQWARLTHLEANQISSDALVHISHHAHNLQDCILHIIERDAGHYPILISPVTNTSIKHFKTALTGIEATFLLILFHLTLPSLETLDCSIENDDSHLSEETEILADFIDRSQPPLQQFCFSYFDYNWRLNAGWYRSLPSITSLDLHVRPDSNTQRVLGYLVGLGAYAEPMALPRLQELRIYADGMNTDCWDALAEIFPNHENDRDAEPLNPRPLNTVQIFLETCFDFGDDIDIMPEGVHARLCAIQNSGVTLCVSDGNGRVIL